MAVNLIGDNTEQQNEPVQQNQAPATSSTQQVNNSPTVGESQTSSTSTSNTTTQMGANPGSTSQPPKQSVLEVAYPRLQTASQKAPQQKATGFTNLNRIMQANTGNKLGQTVSGGITQGVQNVQSGITQSQQKFNEEAQKKRLDTEEAAAQRQGVLDRFNQGTYQPDMSKFQISPEIQADYEAKRQGYLDQKNAASPMLQKAQLDLDSATEEANRLKNIFENTKPGASRHGLVMVSEAKKAYDQAEAKRLNLEKQFNDLTKSSSFDTELSNLETNYNNLVEAQKQAFIDSEQKRLMQESLPTEKEIKEFSRFRTGTYTGPEELQDVSSLYGKALQTQQMGDLARSSGGRQELLRRFVGGDDYTQGQRTLDEAILGQDKSTNLGSAARQTRGAVSDVEKANLGASNLAQEYKNRASIFGNQTREMIGQTRDPISNLLNERVASAERIEASNKDSLNSIRDILSGTGENTKLMDPNTRLGLALTQAQMSGFLNEQDIQEMVGPNGVIQRAFSLGLDPNKMLLERIEQKSAQNINRAGLATEEEIARLNALDRLAGKQGADLEFLQGQPRYEAGGIGFGLEGLKDYLTKTENEKAAKDAKYADELEAERAKYLNQALAGAQQGLGGGLNSLGSSLGASLDLLTGAHIYNPKQFLTNASGIVQGTGDAIIGSMGANAALSNAAIEGLLKLNIGGQSIANTPAGKQLLQALELKSKLTNEALGIGKDVVGNYAEGLSDLGAGRIDQAFMQLSGIELAKNLSQKITNNISREVETAARKVRDTVSKALGYKGSWCFSLDTIIELEKGSILITDLKVGDEVFLGGKVLSIEIKDTDPSIVLEYNGVHLTEDHKVLENKQMIAIKHSEKKKPSSKSITQVVSIITEKHIVIANDTIFSDCWQEGIEE